MNKVSKLIVVSLIATGIAGSTLVIAANNNAAQTPLTSNLTINQVSELALAAQPGVIEEISLEREAGKVVFEIEIETADGDIEIVMDADTGMIISMDKEDSKDGHHDEHKDKNS